MTFLLCFKPSGRLHVRLVNHLDLRATYQACRRGAWQSLLNNNTAGSWSGTRSGNSSSSGIDSGCGNGSGSGGAAVVAVVVAAVVVAVVVLVLAVGGGGGAGVGGGGGGGVSVRSRSSRRGISGSEGSCRCNTPAAAVAAATAIGTFNILRNPKDPKQKTWQVSSQIRYGLDHRHTQIPTSWLQNEYGHLVYHPRCPGPVRGVLCMPDAADGALWARRVKHPGATIARFCYLAWAACWARALVASNLSYPCSPNLPLPAATLLPTGIRKATHHALSLKPIPMEAKADATYSS